MFIMGERYLVGIDDTHMIHICTVSISTLKFNVEILKFNVEILTVFNAEKFSSKTFWSSGPKCFA